MMASGMEKTIATMMTLSMTSMTTAEVISRGTTPMCRDMADLLASGAQVGGPVRLDFLDTALDAFNPPVHTLQGCVEAQVVLRGCVPERLNLGADLQAQRIEGALHVGVRLRARL